MQYLFNMAKVLMEIDNDLIEFFLEHIDDTEPVEVLLHKMLKLLKELLTEAAIRDRTYPC